MLFTFCLGYCIPQQIIGSTSGPHEFGRFFHRVQHIGSSRNKLGVGFIIRCVGNCANSQAPWFGIDDLICARKSFVVHFPRTPRMLCFCCHVRFTFMCGYLVKLYWCNLIYTMRHRFPCHIKTRANDRLQVSVFGPVPGRDRCKLVEPPRYSARPLFTLPCC